ETIGFIPPQSSAELSGGFPDVGGAGVDDEQAVASRPIASTPERKHPNVILAARGSLRARVATVAAGAAVVLFADIFKESELVPIGPERELEVLRERPREDLGIVDGDLVLQLVPRAPQ